MKAIKQLELIPGCGTGKAGQSRCSHKTARRLFLMALASSLLLLPGVAQGQTYTNVTGAETSIVGSGRNDFRHDVDVSGSITVGQGNAISVGSGDSANHGKINVSGTVTNHANSGGGLYGTGPNTIEVGSYYDIHITNTGKVESTGTQNNGEAINVHGGGNTITIDQGGIVYAGQNNAAIWFQDENSNGGKNTVNNAGIIQRGGTAGTDPGTVYGNVIGTSHGNGIKFVNESTGRVYGSLNFSYGDDELTFHASGMGTGSVTGNIDGGGGYNTLELTGNNDDKLSGYVKNFQELNKNGAGTWTITGSMEGFQDVNVNEGVLELLGDNRAFTGNMTINQSGMNNTATLRASSQTLSQDVLNNGFLEFRQSVDGVYTGYIHGSGGVQKTGTGRVELNHAGGNSYAGTTTIEEGTLAFGNENQIGQDDLLIGVATTQNSAIVEFTDNIVLSADRRIDVGTVGGVINTGSYNATIERGSTYTDIGGASTNMTASLTKTGSGTLTVKRDMLYNGDTFVDDGHLILDSAAKLGNATVLPDPLMSMFAG